MGWAPWLGLEMPSSVNRVLGWFPALLISKDIINNNNDDNNNNDNNNNEDNNIIVIIMIIMIIIIMIMIIRYILSYTSNKMTEADLG